MRKAVQKRFLSFLGRPCAVPFILFLLGVTLNSCLLIFSAVISVPSEQPILKQPIRGACDDNIAGKCFEGLVTPPIDVVYTWVNGSDPIQIKGKYLQETKTRKSRKKRKQQKEENKEKRGQEKKKKENKREKKKKNKHEKKSNSKRKKSKLFLFVNFFLFSFKKN